MSSKTDFGNPSPQITTNDHADIEAEDYTHQAHGQGHVICDAQQPFT